MEEKLYHIVDPETGKVIEKRYIGGLSKLLYQMVSTGWSKRLRWALRIALLLCVVLIGAEPVSRDTFPAIYDCAEAILLLVIFSAGSRIFWFVLNFSERKRKKEEKLYQIVDPEAEKVVGTLHPEDVKDVKIQVDTTSPADRFDLVMSHVFMACFLLAFLSILVSFFIPDDWGWLLMISFMVFFVLMWFSELIRRYNPYDQKNKEASKFERTMAHFTFACSSLAVLFGVALFLVPDGWSSRVGILAGVFALLAAIGESAWRSEKKDREGGDGADK